MPHLWGGGIIITKVLIINSNEKKCSEALQTLHASLAVSKAEPKIYAPPQTPFLWAQDGQNLTS